jgi:hypothetical protein
VDVLTAVAAALDEHFGQQAVRASVSYLGVEPIEVLRYEPIPGEVAYLSLGMSRRPMTPATASHTAADGPRAELMLHLRSGTPGAADAWRALALLAAAPAVEGVVYTPGMTVDTGHSFAPGSRCTGAVVVDSAVAAIPLGPGATASEEVAVLQLLPASAAELAWARVHGAAALRALWREQECDLLDLGRQGADLPAVGA